MVTEHELRAEVLNGVQVIDQVLNDLERWEAQGDNTSISIALSEAKRAVEVLDGQLTLLRLMPCRSQNSWQVEFQAHIAQIAYHQVAFAWAIGHNRPEMAEYHRTMAAACKSEAIVASATAASF